MSVSDSFSITYDILLPRIMFDNSLSLGGNLLHPATRLLQCWNWVRKMDLELKISIWTEFKYFLVVFHNFLHLSFAFSTRINWLQKFGLYPSNIDLISPWLSIDYCSEGQAHSVKRFFNSACYSIKYRQDKTMFSITETASMISQWVIYSRLALHG